MFLFPKIFVGFWVVSMALIGGAAYLAHLRAIGGAPMLLAFHMLVGLAAAFMNLLLHTAVMMHTVGTGRALKLAAPHIENGDDYVQRQLKMKNRSYPLAAITCVVCVVTAILGGAANFGFVDAADHRGWFWALVGLNLFALPWGYVVTKRSSEINHEVEVALEAKVEDMKARGELPPEGKLMPWQQGG